MAQALQVPIAGPGFENDVTFVDEFHYDAEGTAMLAGYFGDAIETLL